ncbi:hypothetical protein V5O48_015448 [Marasmius crinis-equi]|uniref:Uncharacterized protein n=1 Tax=Marasmius crinis-equi TaxID=585013 RepID=A0ABR3EUI2_9AGAR
MGPWAMNVSVVDIYNTSLFTHSPVRNASSQPQDFFFANDVGEASARLPGLRLNGSCAPSNISSTDLDGLNSTNSLTQFCKSNIPQFQGNSPLRVESYTWNYTDPAFFAISLYSCNNATFDDDRPPRATQTGNVGYFFYQYAVRQDQKLQRGLIQCRSTLSTGFANVSGLDRSYTNFAEQQIFSTKATNGVETLDLMKIDPIYVIFSGLGQDGNSTERSIQDGLGVPGLGFHLTGDGIHRRAPSLQEISNNLWSGIAHLVAAVGVISKDDSEPFDVLIPTPVAVYTRDLPWACGACVLLTLWFALIIGITAWGYRRTFSHNLDSYVAAELIARERWLLEDVPLGEIVDNHRLKAPFKALDLHKEYISGRMGFESEKLKRSETGSSY